MRTVLLILLLVIPLSRAEEVPPILQGVKLETRLNKPVPLDLTFRDEDGNDVRLGSLLRSGKPAILALAYFRCPRLCNLVLSGLSDGLRDLARERGFKVGDELDVIVVSFDPRDTPESAAAKRDSMVEHYGVPGVGPKGWHFLTGHDREIRHLTDAVGFRYRYDFKTGEYVHAAGIFLLTPAGRISNVFHDVTFKASDLYFGLVEASDYKVGKPLRDRVILFCYGYDPERGSYQLRIINLVRLFGVLTVLGIALLIWRLRQREKRLALKEEGGSPCSPSFS